MTISDYAKMLEQLKADAETQNLSESVMLPAANRLLGTIKNRIVRDGLNSNNQKIGDYSTTPIYVSKEQFVKKGSFKPLGKGGFKGERIVERKLKSGAIKRSIKKTKPQTMYLENGYKQLREIQGMDISKINLKYSGDLIINNYKIATKGKTTILLGITTEEDAKKREGLEARFGAILSGTKEELKVYEDEVFKRYVKVLDAQLKASL